ncbi:MAG: insulinase family protein [Ardenticatenaceae bacterium]|nr:insulinase family protein [Ardenticatenaceae bacterium]MCB9445628.1 insulinase family protein [Ardenticatenaceae bacterium]
MTNSHGFELVKEQEIPELNSKARLFRHIKTGAELLSLENDDDNKVFDITFRTPPEDSTGIAHIMEHCVLGGSRKYQVKEPFVELIKGSLYTFVNAFTSSDWTTYPVASTNLQDYYNLVDVYLDAVFYPLITPNHLAQEGWHYELENVADPLIFKGVVFNEMKGAYSSPDNVFVRYNQQSIFPDNAYGHDSGGDPTVIPDLTYAQFKQFHETLYHPSNARIFFYGDDDPEERLWLMDEWLRDFDRIDVDSLIPLQEYFARPQRATHPYSVDGDAVEAKAFVQVNWMLPENSDPVLTMALEVLSYALVSTPASPLRKALIDSGLGEDVTGGGFSTRLRQNTFGVGLKGIALADADKVEALILQTLEDLAENGLEPDMVEAAVNTIEFSLRENNTGNFPRGLSLAIRALSTWLYDRDPLAPLAFEEPLTAVKNKLTNHPTYLQDLIRQHLLDNPHRSTVILEPDAELADRLEEAEKKRLADVKAGLSEDELLAIIDETRELKRLQEAPDTPEALATIPRLTLADLDKENKTIPLAVSDLHGSELLYHDLFTNGIVYLDLGFDLHTLPADLLPYVKLFGRALVEIGTETEDFVKLSQRIGRKTGGIWPGSFTSTMENGRSAATRLFLRGKATMDQAQDMLDIMRDVLLMVKLDNQARFRQMVLEAKAGKEAGLVPSGHIVTNTRLRSHFTEADWVSEQIGGIEYLFFLRQLADAVENDWPSVLAKLEEVRRLLVNRSSLVVNVTLDEANYGRFLPILSDFVTAVPANPLNLIDWSPEFSRTNEGLTIPAQVNYVGKGANLYDLGYQLHGSVSVIGKYLGTTYLWEKIRVQGGAYGGFSTFDRFSGVWSYLSYRDPNLLGTLANYDGTADFLRNLDLSQAELTSSIIGAIGGIDSYQLPDAKGYTSMSRHLIGESDVQRQQYRDEVLATTTADFKALGEVLTQANDAATVVVLGSAEAIAKANESQKDWLDVKKVM